jgi:hypothetical protein
VALRPPDLRVRGLLPASSRRWGYLIIIAAQVKKGNKRLKLRDPAGLPVGAGADNHRESIIGKWLLPEMGENSEFKHPNEAAEKKWGNLEIFGDNTLGILLFWYAGKLECTQ